MLYYRWISRSVLEPHHVIFVLQVDFPECSEPDHECCIAGGFPGVPDPDEICGAAWDGRPAGPE